MQQHEELFTALGERDIKASKLLIGRGERHDKFITRMLSDCKVILCLKD